MIEVVTNIDGPEGRVIINIRNNGQQHQQFSLNWCIFDEKENKTGFVSNFTNDPIFITELAAEHLLRMIVASIIVSLNVEDGCVSIFNHLGEKLDDIEFLPPTAELDEIEIEEFVVLQDNLLQRFSEYEMDEELTPKRIAECRADNVLEDFLSLVQIRVSGLQLSILKPKKEEE